MQGPVPGFSSQQHGLDCDGQPVEAIARAAGTPVHIYSRALIAARYREFDDAFGAYPHRLHYAIKANATLGIVRTLRGLGACADANSGGEIDVALRAGFAPDQIVFTGVGKTREELSRAIALGVGAINAESFGEIDRISDLAAADGRVARVALRVNPDVDAGSHPHISTGSRATKFGVPVSDVREMIHGIRAHANLALVGLHVHVGSQITSVDPLARTAETVADLAAGLLAQGLPLEHLDLGGGLGIPYTPGQTVVSPEAYAAALRPHVAPTGLLLLLEPGRWLVGPVGTLIARVVDLKRRADDGWFVIVDAGMTDLLRPALYGAWHAIEPVVPRKGNPILADIVGPVCETTDTLGTERQMAPVEVGDLIAIRDAGAYGSVMASNYNKRPTAAEVMIEGGAPRLIRRRQTIDDMLQWDL